MVVLVAVVLVAAFVVLVVVQTYLANPQSVLEQDLGQWMCGLLGRHPQQ